MFTSIFGWAKLLVVSLFLAVFVAASPTFAQLSFPSATGWVNDFAGILQPETVAELEAQLSTLEKATGVEVVVVIVDSLQGTTLEDYSIRLAEDWQVGKEGQDNGIILLIAPNEQEMRIEVGYGLEPVLPDSKAGRIIRGVITPAFKVEDYDRGVIEGVVAIIGIVQGEEVDLPEDPVPSSGGEEGGGAWVGFVFIIIFLAVADYVVGYLGRTKDWWLGGVGGGVVGLIIGLIVGGVVSAILASIGAGLFGLLLDYILSKNYKVRKKKGLSTSWWSSGGGFSSGGSSGGGSSFGGFGGGGFGGGGASGKW